MHHFPSEGQARDVGAAIVEMLYPADQPSRIPIVSVTGTNGKDDGDPDDRAYVEESGKVVGLTTTDGIWIGGEEIARGDMTGPWSAGVVLSDPTVEVAVLETARGGIVRSGLGYDWSDISVMTNIHPDHIGQDGIESVEDIVRIKRLVAERVRSGGTLILNADDEHLAQISSHERVAASSEDVRLLLDRVAEPKIQEHLGQNGTAFVAHGGWLEERKGVRGSAGSPESMRSRQRSPEQHNSRSTTLSRQLLPHAHVACHRPRSGRLSLDFGWSNMVPDV